MLRKNEGYFLAELLLSLSTWLVITTTLFPLVFLVWNQASQLSLNNVATHLLYDELERGMNEGVTIGSRTVQVNGTNFEIIWTDGTPLLEVCVKYEDSNTTVFQKCRSQEQ